MKKRKGLTMVFIAINPRGSQVSCQSRLPSEAPLKTDEGRGRRKGEWGGQGQRRNLKLPPNHLPSFTHGKAVFSHSSRQQHPLK